MAATLVRDLTLATAVVRTVDSVALTSGESDIALGAVRYNAAQSLSESEKALARSNIGAGAGSVETVDSVGVTSGTKNIALGAIRYSASQSLTDSEKEQALTNLGASLSDLTLDLNADISTKIGVIATALKRLGLNVTPASGE